MIYICDTRRENNYQEYNITKLQLKKIISKMFLQHLALIRKLFVQINKICEHKLRASRKVNCDIGKNIPRCLFKESYNFVFKSQKENK